MVHGKLATASFLFLQRGAGSNKWFVLMGLADEELTTLARIYYGVERKPDEPDDWLRIRCMEEWKDEGQDVEG